MLDIKFAKNIIDMRKLKNEELKRISVDGYKNSEKMPVVIVLDNIRSLNNIGSVFRTADAFRIEKIFLCGITGQPPHREIHKTALGATESVEWEYFEKTKDVIIKLKNSGYKVIAIEQMDESMNLSLYKPVVNEKMALIFGNEINGISDDIINIIDQCIEIPQFGTKHSFNIAVSVGILLWHIFVNFRK
jgi:23S rRNA (guanosine2251-2'-O)-methyltransferase